MLPTLSLKTKQSLRVAVAAVIAIFFCYAFNIAYNYWMVITILVISQPTVGATLLRSKQRALYTLLGVLVGGLLVVLLQHQFWLMTLVGVFCVFFSVYYVESAYDRAILFFSILIILIFGYYVQDVWKYAIFRVVDTGLGVFIGFLVSLFLFPCRSRDEIKKDFNVLMLDYDQLLAAVFSELIQFSAQGQQQIGRLRVKVVDRLGVTRRHLQELEYEVDLLSLKKTASYSIIHCLDKIRMTLYALNSLSATASTLPAEVLQALKPLQQQYVKQFQQLLTITQQEKALKMPCLRLDEQKMQVFKQQTQAECSFLYLNLLQLEEELNHLQYALNEFYCDEEYAVKHLVA